MRYRYAYSVLIVVLGAASIYLLQQVDPQPAPTTPAPRAPASTTGEPATRSSSTPVPAAPASVSLESELQRLNNCYHQECDYPRTDQRSYEFAVGREIKKKLYQLKAHIVENALVSPKLAQLARDFLQNPDGHVQEAALHVLATQPPSPESLSAILDNIIHGIDAQLIEHALLELERYTHPQDLERIHAALAQAMLTGSPFVATAISENIAPFINEASFSFFDDLSRRLPPNSKTQKHLRTSLEDFARRQDAA